MMICRPGSFRLRFDDALEEPVKRGCKDPIIAIVLAKAFPMNSSLHSSGWKPHESLLVPGEGIAMFDDSTQQRIS